MVPIIVISLTVDYAIQIVSHYREQRNAGGGVVVAVRAGSQNTSPSRWLWPPPAGSGTAVIPNGERRVDPASFRARSTRTVIAFRRGVKAGVAGDDGLSCHLVNGGKRRRAKARYVGSSRLCSAMCNFSFLFGFIDGNGLKRSL